MKQATNAIYRWLTSKERNESTNINIAAILASTHMTTDARKLVAVPALIKEM